MTIRTTKLGLLALPLAACASAGTQLPPTSPDIVSITSVYNQLVSSNVPPAAILNVGMTLDDQNCYGWFDQQILNSQKTALGQSALGLGAGGAAIAGGPGAAAAAGSLGMLSALLGAAQTNSPLGNYPVADLALEVNQRQVWANAVGTPLTPDQAWRDLESYHQLCTIGGISVASAQAKMTVPVSTVPISPPVIIPVSHPAPPPPTTGPRPPVPVPVPPPIPTSPINPTSPTVTPNFSEKSSSYSVTIRHRRRRQSSFFEENQPTFQIVPSSTGLLARPPQVCVGCG